MNFRRIFILMGAILGSVAHSPNVRESKEPHGSAMFNGRPGVKFPSSQSEELTPNQYNRITTSSPRHLPSSMMQPNDMRSPPNRLPRSRFRRQVTADNCDRGIAQGIDALNYLADSSNQQADDFSQTHIEYEDDHLLEEHHQPQMENNRQFSMDHYQSHGHLAAKNVDEARSKHRSNPTPYLIRRNKVHRVKLVRNSEPGTNYRRHFIQRVRRPRSSETVQGISAFDRSIASHPEEHQLPIINKGTLNQVEVPRVAHPRKVRVKRSDVNDFQKSPDSVSEDPIIQPASPGKLHTTMKTTSSNHMNARRNRHLRSVSTFMFNNEEYDEYDFNISLLILLYLTNKHSEKVVHKDFAAKMFSTNNSGLQMMINFSPYDPNDDFEWCHAMKNAPIVKTSCGSTYLLSGYRYQLSTNENETLCTWRFRSTVQSVLINLDSGKQEEQIHVHVAKQFIPYRATRDAVTKILHHEFSLTLNSGIAQELSVEVCIPRKYDTLVHYPVFGHQNEKDITDTKVICGRKRAASPRGIPFNEATDPVYYGTFPWHALLLIHRSSSDADRNPERCSGVLVSKLWVVTMASCFSSVWDATTMSSGRSRMPHVDIYFAVTHYRHIAYSRYFYAEEIVLHPALSSSHDIALVRLSDAPSGLDPVCLPAFDQPHPNEDIVGWSGHVVGWTLRSDSRRPQNQFLSDEAIVRNKECAAWLGEYIPPHTVCSVNSTHSSRCLRDSLLYDITDDRYVLRGLAFNRGRCDGSGLNVFTSVAHFVPWIAGVVAEQGNALPPDPSESTKATV